MSNSFLVVASPDEQEHLPPHILAHTYNATRKKPYCTENIFELSDTGRINVIKQNIYPIPENVRATPVRQKLENEEYRTGQLLSKKIIPIVSRSGWTVNELSQWASSYYSLLTKYATLRDKRGFFLEGRFAWILPHSILSSIRKRRNGYSTRNG